jgi:hypothetical protein
MTTAYAENKESTDTLLPKAELMKQIDRLKKDAEEQKKKYDKEIADLDSKLKRLKDKSQLVKAETERDFLKHRVDSLTKVSVKDQERITSLQSEVESLQNSIDSLIEEYKPMVAFKKEFLKDKFEKSQDYMNRPYSKISVEKLNELKGELAEYSADKDVNRQIKTIDNAIRKKGYVTDMVNVISSPFTQAGIIKARKSFFELQNRKKEFSPAQWAELDTLDIYVSRYNESVIIFQKIIKQCNSIISEFDGSSGSVLTRDCIEQVGEVLKSHEGKDIDERINVIPYLKPRFEKYRKWVLSKPLNKNDEIKTIESEILTLKPKV